MVKQKQEDFAALKELKESLIKDIEKLKIEQSNLIEQNRAEKIRFESIKKLEEVKDKREIVVQEQKIALDNHLLSNRQDAIRAQEESLRVRIRGVENREMELSDIEERRRKLVQERSNFERFKREQEAEINEKKKLIAVIEDASNQLKIREDNVRAREKAVSSK